MNLYRKKISECINNAVSKNIALTLNRVLILSEKEDGHKFFDGTHLYGYQELKKDMEYAIVQDCHEENATKLWTEFLELSNRNDYLSELDSHSLEELRQNKRDKEGRFSDLYQLLNKEKYELYLLPKCNNGDQNIFDFYVNNLHTGNNNCAQYIIVSNDENVITDNNGYTWKKKKIQTKISPNVALIKITGQKADNSPVNEEFILDAYMNIPHNMVKLEVLDEKNSSIRPKYKELNQKIIEIMSKATPLSDIIDSKNKIVVESAMQRLNTLKTTKAAPRKIGKIVEMIKYLNREQNIIFAQMINKNGTSLDSIIAIYNSINKS